ncbi:hypothetical protein F4774DRAFT_429661 [Daldinia eschscholtzii]|nr:hypothetical protein F4774DRAFT_429661 [Daldinia eschscholtzii]
MAKPLLPLGLATVLLCLLLRTVSGVSVNLNDLFVVHAGATKSGCDTYFNQKNGDGTLDDWLEEINYSLSTAIDKIDQKYNREKSIRMAIQTFFGIRNDGRARGDIKVKVDNLSSNLKRVLDFFSFEKITADGPSKGQPIYPLNGNRFLFCGSDFLEAKKKDTVARDWKDNEIKDDKGKAVTIADVTAYANALKADPNNKAWWSGDHTPVKGYYFSTTGGKYCGPATKNLGLTAAIQELEADPSGQPTLRKPVEIVVLCEESFTNTKQPDSYRIGDAKIKAGTNLADVVPKSATLLHEAFHVLFGVDDGNNPTNPIGFLQGDEIYDLAACIQLAKDDPEKARRNPENYVFFLTHMYYLYGEPSGTDPSSIDTNWDFAPIKKGTDYVYGAVIPTWG